MKMFVFPMPGRDPLQVFAAVHHMPYSLFLDSALHDHPASLYSYVLFQPAETIETAGSEVTISNLEQQYKFRDDPFAILKERLSAWGEDAERRAGLPPFQGGAAGLFGYDLARRIEKLPALAAADSAVPDMAVGLYNQLFSFDHRKNQGWHIVHAESEADAKAWHTWLNRLMIENPSVPRQTPQPLAWQSDHTKRTYAESVRRVLDYIRAGDIFQANLSQQFEAALPPGFNPFAHYCRLREINPAPFAAYMNLGAMAVSSASPERFLKVSGRKVETRPIKGTRPSHDDPHIDMLYRNDLQNNEKDRAENAMIVDLLRNDLSKVCEDHSVDVPELCAVESYPGLHHLVSAVTATLRADQSGADLMRACFPGGSITGCPKIRAMEIIEELEARRRGPYCGSIGFIGYDGAMDSSILIRTLVYENGRVSFHVGGGVVADSDPEREYRETLDKARLLFKSFTGEEPAGRAADEWTESA